MRRPSDTSRKPTRPIIIIETNRGVTLTRPLRNITRAATKIPPVKMIASGAIPLLPVA